MKTPFLLQRRGVFHFRDALFGTTQTWEEVVVVYEKKPSPRIIKSRFNMMAEGIIPHEAFANLHEKHVKIFLTEPDPKKWPEELSHLKKYVPDDTVA